jgi:Zn-dependent peptidase ImmA (M78 family)
MKRIKPDKNGVPILNRTGIENWAENFVAYFDPRALATPMPATLDIITADLRENHSVTFIFDGDLGQTPKGHNLRGRFHVKQNTIYIDKSLDLGTHRFNFTLAHEIAHFVLHRKMNMAALKESSFEDTDRELILDHVEGANLRSLVEWQANKFASSILLPRKTIKLAVIRKQKELGISRNIGTIHADDQHYNSRDWRDLLEFLVSTFNVSKTAIKIRLLELSILLEKDRYPPGQGLESIQSIAQRAWGAGSD